MALRPTINGAPPSQERLVRAFRLEHLNDRDLLTGLDRLVAKERGVTAEVLAHIAEVDARKLYLPAGYASMLLYCVQHLRFSEDAAKKRIQAARAAREFPALFAALEEGRLHLSGVVLLAPYLPRCKADELMDAASFKTRLEIERVIAERFPSTELLPLVVAKPASNDEGTPGHLEERTHVESGSGAADVAETDAENPRDSLDEGAPGHLGLAEQAESANGANASDVVSGGVGNRAGAQGAPGHLQCSASRSKAKPLAAGRYELHLSISESTYQKLCYARDLLSHAIPSGDLSEVFERLVAAGLPRLEKARTAATEKPRRMPRQAPASPRSIPAHVRRAVWRRDGGRCTFVSASGHRCESRHLLELDHIVPVARGGKSTVENLRARCRAHNQFAADRAFGVEFMKEKRAAGKRHSVRQRPKASAQSAQLRSETSTRTRDHAAEATPPIASPPGSPA